MRNRLIYFVLIASFMGMDSKASGAAPANFDVNMSVAVAKCTFTSDRRLVCSVPVGLGYMEYLSLSFKDCTDQPCKSEWHSKVFSVEGYQFQAKVTAEVFNFGNYGVAASISKTNNKNPSSVFVNTWASPRMESPVTYFDNLIKSRIYPNTYYLPNIFIGAPDQIDSAALTRGILQQVRMKAERLLNDNLVE
jgi:hypothetical protein